jgi:hypothetical protein
MIGLLVKGILPDLLRMLAESLKLAQKLLIKIKGSVKYK